ncbi:MAG TPA: hypothetical protein VK142_01765, partial [Bacillota bacterium]|nr:hypothetical protein [Bacillota bacterium]
MIYKLQDAYYIISEGNHIGFYNLPEAKFDTLLKVDNQNVRKLFLKLNRPFDIDELPHVEQTFVKKILKQYFNPYFAEIDKETLMWERHKHRNLDGFLSLNGQAFDLDLQGLGALVKETINYTTYCFVTDLEKTYEDQFPGYTIRHMTYQQLKGQDIDWYNTIFIVDSQSMTDDQLWQFEKKCLETQVIRMYFREDKETIVIGPTFIGEEFGCLFCSGQSTAHIKNEKKRSGYNCFSMLTLSLISTEMLKISRKVVSALIDDNTISKGKHMTLSKYNLSANEYEVKPDVDCRL